MQLLLPAGTLDICRLVCGLKVSFSSIEENAFLRFVRRHSSEHLALEPISFFAVLGGLDPCLR